MSDAVRHYFLDRGDGRFTPTRHTEGAWARDEQHMAPISGLLLKAVTDHEPRPELQIARISFDILGKIPLGDFQVSTTTLRRGRTIELVQAEASHDDRSFLRATVWRLLRTDTTSVAGGPAPVSLPDPAKLASTDLDTDWGGGYIESIELRLPDRQTPGHGEAWLRTDIELVNASGVSDLARLTGMIDTANGLAPLWPPDTWMFPNTDLTIHAYRQPTGRWLGLVTDAHWGPTGVGLTSSTLLDEHGAWGRAEQILTVRPLKTG